MASKENQEALEYLKKEMGADFIFSDDNISKCLNTLQQAIDELQNLKENYIGFEDMNYELKVYKKALKKKQV